MTIKNIRIIASILFVLISFVCVAQGSGPPPPAPPGPPGLPVDGGVIVGAIVALFYGTKKLIQRP